MTTQGVLVYDLELVLMFLYLRACMILALFRPKYINTYKCIHVDVLLVYS